MSEDMPQCLCNFCTADPIDHRSDYTLVTHPGVLPRVSSNRSNSLSIDICSRLVARECATVTV